MDDATSLDDTVVGITPDSDHGAPLLEKDISDEAMDATSDKDAFVQKSSSSPSTSTTDTIKNNATTAPIKTPADDPSRDEDASEMNTSDVTESLSEDDPDSALAQLISMGFDPDLCMTALAECVADREARRDSPSGPLPGIFDMTLGWILARQGDESEGYRDAINRPPLPHPSTRPPPPRGILKSPSSSSSRASTSGPSIITGLSETFGINKDWLTKQMDTAANTLEATITKIKTTANPLFGSNTSFEETDADKNPSFSEGNSGARTIQPLRSGDDNKNQGLFVISDGLSSRGSLSSSSLNLNILPADLDDDDDDDEKPLSNKKKVRFSVPERPEGRGDGIPPSMQGLFTPLNATGSASGSSSAPMRTQASDRHGERGDVQSPLGLYQHSLLQNQPEELETARSGYKALDEF
ncbi:hypothetical protein HDV05_001064 [Chytridiales sp. JEL 0842]|nr:hypothetical protein HDV05_001064 [Chytridiales sp. JEL 0842]